MFTLEELTEKIPLLIISGEKINELQILYYSWRGKH